MMENIGQYLTAYNIFCAFVVMFGTFALIGVLSLVWIGVRHAWKQRRLRRQLAAMTPAERRAVRELSILNKVEQSAVLHMLNKKGTV